DTESVVASGIDRRKIRDGHAVPACSTVSFARGQHAGHRVRVAFAASQCFELGDQICVCCSSG
ncbi:MAG TPA: hypothetical protein VN744_04555, partial [Casimicrobiaceae bacterium]|nr:hypothetical protein [Casimicrobiaceae bacterium]